MSFFEAIAKPQEIAIPSEDLMRLRLELFAGTLRRRMTWTCYETFAEPHTHTSIGMVHEAAARPWQQLLKKRNICIDINRFSKTFIQKSDKKTKTKCVVKSLFYLRLAETKKLKTMHWMTVISFWCFKELCDPSIVEKGGWNPSSF